MAGQASEEFMNPNYKDPEVTDKNLSATDSENKPVQSENVQKSDEEKQVDVQKTTMVLQIAWR